LVGHLLASDSEDEKSLGRAEKEAREDTKRQTGKRRYGKQLARGKRPVTLSRGECQ